MDYLRQKDAFDLLPYCIATRDHVKSVMLFSNHGWKDLEGKIVGITDDTATSVQLLNVLLRKKYGVRAEFRRMHAGVNDLEGYDAVLLIGDEALRANKHGLNGFELCFDLATEWYEWQKLPFVFAVWAGRKTLDSLMKAELEEVIRVSLESAEDVLDTIGTVHGQRVGLTPSDAEEYLRCFTYKIGERELEAIDIFQAHCLSLEVERTQERTESRPG
jgi:chorismate dehydratase